MDIQETILENNILELLRKHKKVGPIAIARNVHETVSLVVKSLNKLVNLGLVEVDRSDELGSLYSIVDKDQEKIESESEIISLEDRIIGIIKEGNATYNDVIDRFDQQDRRFALSTIDKMIESGSIVLNVDMKRGNGNVIFYGLPVEDPKKCDITEDLLTSGYAPLKNSNDFNNHNGYVYRNYGVNFLKSDPKTNDDHMDAFIDSVNEKIIKETEKLRKDEESFSKYRFKRFGLGPLNNIEKDIFFAEYSSFAEFAFKFITGDDMSKNKDVDSESQKPFMGLDKNDIHVLVIIAKDDFTHHFANPFNGCANRLKELGYVEIKNNKYYMTSEGKQFLLKYFLSDVKW